MGDVTRADTAESAGIEVNQLLADRIYAMARPRADLVDERRVCEKSDRDLSVCRAAMEEAARRDAYGDLYATRSTPETATETWQMVFKAARANLSQYENPTHGPSELNCRLAYDAGLGWGYANPAAPVVPELNMAEIDAMAEQCFAPDGSGTPLQGLLAGARHGQAFHEVTLQPEMQALYIEVDKDHGVRR